MLNPSFFVAYELAGVGGVSPLSLLHTLSSYSGNLGNPMENGWGAPYTGRAH